MNKEITTLFLAASISMSGQLIHSNTSKISIRDGNQMKKDYWTISPKVRPDIYETVSSDMPHKVTFITDVDSISFDVTINKNYSFVVLLNGKDSAHTQISGLKELSGTPAFVLPPPFLASQVKQLYTVVFPFGSVTPARNNEKTDYTDLASFGRIAGDAQIIALGESTHGTSEFFSMKHRALEYAVINLGVRVFALEDNQLHVEQVNNYVLTGKGKLNTIVRGLFGVWVRQEVVTMIEWIKNYNLSHLEKKVEFVGFDMQNPWMAYDSLEAFLSKKDPSLKQQISEKLAAYKKGFAGSYSAGENDKINWFSSARQVLDMMLSEKPIWLKNAKNNIDSISIEWAVQNANIIRQSARSILTGQLRLFRDSAMAENIKWTLSMRKPGTRMLVWAHDFHISRGDNPVAVNNYYNGLSMGSWLSKWYGNKYKAFGLETYSGEFTAMKSYTDYDLINCTMVTSPVGTLDEALHQISVKKQSPYLFVDMDKVRAKPKEFKWLFLPCYVRFANHVCEGNSYGLKHVIPHQFDGIFYIDHTTGSKLIK